MTRAVIKLKDGTYINVTANWFDIDKGMLLVRNDDIIVAIVRIREVMSCHLSEQKERNNNV